MARRTSAKKAAANKAAYPLPITSPREVTPEPAQAEPSSDGPTTAYKDGDDGCVLVLNCEDGIVPKGWHDTPAKCKNCDGKSHPTYMEVKAE